MQSADLIIYNATIRTMEQSTPVTDTVAIRGGRVVALGNTDCGDLRGSETEMLSVDGATIVPAFHDAHTHPVTGGLDRRGCSLDDVHGIAAYREKIAAYADRLGRGEWLLGSGWYGDAFPTGYPTRQELDALVHDRPAAVTSHDGHGVWASSAALQRAGIDARTPDPDGGRIVRDANGDPTGLLMESAMDLVMDLLPPVQTPDIAAAILESQAYYHSLGIVGWQDAGIGAMLGGPDTFTAYANLQRNGSLTAKVTGAL